MSAEPLRQPTAWRLMLAAFALWAANFLVGYAFALIFPDRPVTRIALFILFVLSAPAFWWIDRARHRTTAPHMVRLSAAIAALATLFNAIVAFA